MKYVVIELLKRPRTNQAVGKILNLHDAQSPSGGRHAHFMTVCWINKARCPPRPQPIPPSSTTTTTTTPSSPNMCESALRRAQLLRGRKWGEGGGGRGHFQLSQFLTRHRLLRFIFLIKDIEGLSPSPCVHNKLNGVSFEQSKHLFSPSSLFTSYPWEGAALSLQCFISSASATGSFILKVLVASY